MRIMNPQDWNYHRDAETQRELSKPSVSLLADFDVGHASACPSQWNSLTATTLLRALRYLSGLKVFLSPCLRVSVVNYELR